MTLEEKITELKAQYDCVAVIDMDPWHDLVATDRKAWMRDTLEVVHRSEYSPEQRLIFTLSRGDVYSDTHSRCGDFLTQFQRRLNEIDISNFFVILLTTDQTMADCYQQWQSTISTDSVPIEISVYDAQITQRNYPSKGEIKKRLDKQAYRQLDPLKIDIDDLNQREQFLIRDSKRFCIYPWIHMHAYPTGQAYPCCMADMQFPVGNMRTSTMKEIWNDEPMRKIRRQMLDEESVPACTRCYEQESHGFVSGRQSANKHFGHSIDRINRTEADGTFNEFEMTYWDVRFSNLCNLKCRSCGHIFSSQWAQDQAKLSKNTNYFKQFPVLNYAGRWETDAWEQLSEHLDYVEQIYFAGGEPLLMEEHYNILDELVRRKRFDVRLIYNTNFTHTDLKGKSVFEYWKLFDSVSVGASLDDSGARGEYIRKGTDWAVVEQNRRNMLEICPGVDFYISPTLSIMNALHLPDFHRDWVEAGLIRAQDLNVNLLQDPAHYRIDIATPEYKAQIRDKFEQHIAWLDSQDNFQRATVGFRSALNFLDATDNSALIPRFWAKTQELDEIRKENILDVIPELVALK